MAASPLQSGPPGDPLAIAGTVGLFALFLSITAHIAARNVLGDVAVRKAFVVGPAPATIGVLAAAFGVNSFLALGVAVLVDGLLIGYLYGQDRRLTAYITFIHVVVSIILGTVVFGLYVLALSAPG
jgi:hypothetical protein